jgi:FAD/FMN-containing dehydrogenase
LRRPPVDRGDCAGEFFTAEHGEGVAVMRTRKRALNPDNILNPGKVVRL